MSWSTGARSSVSTDGVRGERRAWRVGSSTEPGSPRRATAAASAAGSSGRSDGDEHEVAAPAGASWSGRAIEQRVPEPGGEGGRLGRARSSGYAVDHVEHVDPVRTQHPAHLVDELGGGQVPRHRAGAERVADDEVRGRRRAARPARSGRRRSGRRRPGIASTPSSRSAQLDDAAVDLQHGRAAYPGRVAASQRGMVKPPPPRCTASSGAPGRERGVDASAKPLGVGELQVRAGRRGRRRSAAGRRARAPGRAGVRRVGVDARRSSRRSRRRSAPAPRPARRRARPRPAVRRQARRVSRRATGNAASSRHTAAVTSRIDRHRQQRDQHEPGEEGAGERAERAGRGQLPDRPRRSRPAPVQPGPGDGRGRPWPARPPAPAWTAATSSTAATGPGPDGRAEQPDERAHGEHAQPADGSAPAATRRGGSTSAQRPPSAAPAAMP